MVQYLLSELKKERGDFYGGTGRTENNDAAGVGADGAAAASGRGRGRADRQQELPLGKIASLGVAFEPIMDLVQSVAGPGVQSQLYKVTTRQGTFGCVPQWQQAFGELS